MGTEPGGRRSRYYAFAALILSIFLLTQLLFFAYGRDQGVYAVVGSTMLEGKAPYADAWDIKPPGIYMTYALTRTVLGTGQHAIRVVEAIAFLSLIYAFFILSRRFTGNGYAGVVGAAVAILSHVQLEFWHTGQPEGFGAVAIAWALVLVTSSTHAKKRHMVLGGFLFGIAFLLKPHLGAGLLVTALISKSRLRSFALMSVGAAIPVILVMAYLTAAGAVPAMMETLFGFVPYYIGISMDLWSLPGYTLLALERWLYWFSPLMVIGLFLLIVMPPLSSREREGTWHVGGIILLQLAGVVMQAKLIPYHYAGLLPLTALLAGWGLWKLWLRSLQRGWTTFVYLALMVMIASATTRTQEAEGPSYHFWPRVAQRGAGLMNPEERQTIFDGLSTHYDVDAATNRSVADWLVENTAEDDTVFIWGFEPVIYDLSARRPASRYIQNQPLRAQWHREETRSRLLEDLRESRPAAVLVVKGDPFPLLTGNYLDSAGELLTFPGLREFIMAGYEPAMIIGDFEIYKAKSDPSY